MQVAGSIVRREGISAWTRLTATVASAATLAIVLLTASAATAAIEWPSYRGGPSQNMNRVEDPGLHPEQVWQSIESVRDEPCVIAVGESAFTIATPKADFGAQRLFRIDLATGVPVWSTFPFEAAQRASCPASDGSRVYFASGPVLAAVDVTNGELAWVTELGGTVGKPVAAKGAVFVNSGENVFALDASDGSIVWKAPAETSERPPLLIGTTVVNVGSKESISAYGLATGEVLWFVEGGPDAIGVGDSVVYSRAGKAVVSRDAQTGSLEWSYSVPPLTAAKKLVADDAAVYALTPSTDVRFQVNHLIALDLETGGAKYVREYDPVESCCGTTAAYPPFVKFGARLYNHYRYFDPETGKAPGGESDKTHSVFFDPSGGSCAIEQDSNFAHVGTMIVVWKNLCTRTVLVAREAGPESEPEGPGPVELIQPGPGALVGARPQFGWKVGLPFAVSHYELVIDASTFAEVTPGKEGAVFFTPTEDLSDGSHSWSVVAVDKSGGRTTSETRSFTVDGSPPAPFALLKPQDGSTTNAKPEFAWEPAVDVGPAGLDRYELIIDKEIWAKVPAGTESVIAPFELSQGNHTWSVVAVDQAGNRRPSGTRTFTVDAVGPQGIELIEPLDSLTGPRPQFRWYAAVDFESDVDRYELVSDEEVFTTIPSEKGMEIVSFTPSEDLGEGGHTWSVRAFDVAGNFKQSETRKFVVDSSAPSPFNLISPEEGAIVAPRPQFAWQASTDSGSGIARYELVVDGETFVSEGESYTLPFDLSDGAHSWFVVAVDQAGNRTQSETRSFTVDGSPPAPFALLKPADGAVTDARPLFAWQSTVDVGAAGLVRYELLVDKEVVAELPAGTESFTQDADLAAGQHVWSVAAVDALGNRRQTTSRSFIVASPPIAKLAESSVLALTGTPVSFDATGSTAPPGGEISSYEWDLNGDGAYELDTGTTPVASRTYSAVEDLTVSVRVRSNLGTDATAATKVSVRLAPPAGPLGVTINDGARFTNTPNVTVSLVWPLFASIALLSNDGGFRAAGSFALASTIPWKLDPAGTERLPRTIYVRFQGGEAGRETYQDDIVLDEKKPKVTGASVVDDSSVLTVRAVDGVSGVASMEVRSGGWDRLKWVPFRSKLRLRRSGKPIFVRVRDRAGNRSRWRRAAIVGSGGSGRARP